MLVFRVLFIIIIFVCSSFASEASKAAKRICADPKCSEPISIGDTTQNYPSGAKDQLSFSKGANVSVYSKPAASKGKEDLWEIEIEGKRGFAPKMFIKERKILVEHPNYTISPEELSEEEEDGKVQDVEEPKAGVTQLSAEESSNMTDNQVPPEAAPTSLSDSHKPLPSHIDPAPSSEKHPPTHNESEDSSSESQEITPPTSLPELHPRIDPSSPIPNGDPPTSNESEDSSSESQEVTPPTSLTEFHPRIDPSSPIPNGDPPTSNESPTGNQDISKSQEEPPSTVPSTPEIQPTSVPSSEAFFYMDGTKIPHSHFSSEEVEAIMLGQAKPPANPVPRDNKVEEKAEMTSSSPNIAPSSLAKVHEATTSSEIIDDPVSKESSSSEKLMEKSNKIESLPKEKDFAAQNKAPATIQEPPQEQGASLIDYKEEGLPEKEVNNFLNKTITEKTIKPEANKKEEIIAETNEVAKEQAASTNLPPSPSPLEKETIAHPEEEPKQELEHKEKTEEQMTDTNPLPEAKENMIQEKEEMPQDETPSEEEEEGENLPHEKEGDLNPVAQLEEGNITHPPLGEEAAQVNNSSEERANPTVSENELPEKVTNRVETPPKEPLALEEELKAETEGPESIPFLIHSLRSQLQVVLDLLPETIQLAIIDLKVSPHLVIFAACFTFFFLSLSITFVFFDKRGELQRLSSLTGKSEQQMFALAMERDSFKKDLELYRSKVTSHSNTFQTMKQSLDQELESTKAESIKLQTQVDALTDQREKYLQLNECLKVERDEAVAQNLKLVEENKDLCSKLLTAEEDLALLSSAHEELVGGYQQEEFRSSQLQENCKQLLEEAKAWDSRVKELEVDLASNKNLLSKASSALEARELELKSLQLVLQEMSSQENAHDSQEVEEKMAKILDVGKLKEKVKELEEEKESLVTRLYDKDSKIHQLESEGTQLREELSHIQAEHNTLLQEQTEAQTKFSVLNQYFKEKEVQLQRELGYELTKRQQKETDATQAERTLELLEKENESYKQQLATLRQEYELDTRHLKAKISEEQKKAHDNWHSLRNTDRKLDEALREAQNLRQKMTAMEKEHAIKLKNLMTQKAGGSEVGSITQQSDDSLELGGRPGVLPTGRPMPPLFAPLSFDRQPPQFFGERPPFHGGGDPWPFHPPVPPPFPPPHFSYERPPPGRMPSPPPFDNRMGSGRIHRGKREEPRFTSPRPGEEVSHRHTPPSGGSPMPRRGVYPSPPDPRGLPPGKFQPIPGRHPAEKGHRLSRRDRPPPDSGGGDVYNSQRSPTNIRTSPKEDMV